MLRRGKSLQNFHVAIEIKKRFDRSKEIHVSKFDSETKSLVRAFGNESTTLSAGNRRGRRTTLAACLRYDEW
jgi:hypothetical protein